jgi:hypothetical protein
VSRRAGSAGALIRSSAAGIERACAAVGWGGADTELSFWPAAAGPASVAPNGRSGSRRGAGQAPPRSGSLPVAAVLAAGSATAATGAGSGGLRVVSGLIGLGRTGAGGLRVVSGLIGLGRAGAGGLRVVSGLSGSGRAGGGGLRVVSGLSGSGRAGAGGLRVVSGPSGSGRAGADGAGRARRPREGCALAGRVLAGGSSAWAAA